MLDKEIELFEVFLRYSLFNKCNKLFEFVLFFFKKS